MKMGRPAASELVPRLMAEFGYPEPGAELVAGKLIGTTQVIWDAFWPWWCGETWPELSIEGYTRQCLMDEHGQNSIAAILTLDWLVRMPTKAKAVLRKGHDHVA